jgi:hypothetical protein
MKTDTREQAELAWLRAKITLASVLSLVLSVYLLLGLMSTIALLAIAFG